MVEIGRNIETFLRFIIFWYLSKSQARALRYGTCYDILEGVDKSVIDNNYLNELFA